MYILEKLFLTWKLDIFIPNRARNLVLSFSQTFLSQIGPETLYLVLRVHRHFNPKLGPKSCTSFSPNPPRFFCEILQDNRAIIKKVDNSEYFEKNSCWARNSTFLPGWEVFCLSTFWNAFLFSLSQNVRGE